MNELVAANRASDWRRLKALVLASVSSPITRRVYNLGLDEFIAWFQQEPRPAGFTKATACSRRNWRRGSPVSRASGRTGSAPGTGFRSSRRRCF